MSASATCQPESPLLGACASFDFQIQIPRAHAAGFDAAEANALRVLVDMRTPLGAPRAPPQSSSSSRNHKRAKPLLLHVEDLGNENAPAPSLNVDVPVVHVGKAKPALAKQPPVAAMPHERKPASKQASRIQRSSTHAGVSWHKNRNKWLANFTVAGKTESFGYFVDEAEAGATAAYAKTKLAEGMSVSAIKLNIKLRRAEV